MGLVPGTTMAFVVFVSATPFCLHFRSGVGWSVAPAPAMVLAAFVSDPDPAMLLVNFDHN